MGYALVFLKQINKTLVLGLLCFIASSDSYARLVVEKHVEVFKKEGIYACFPEVFKDQDGSLVVSVSARESNSHYGGNAKNILMVSRDEGITWAESNKMHLNQSTEFYDNSYSLPFAGGWRKISEKEAAELKKEGIEIHKDKGEFFFSKGLQSRRTLDAGRSWKISEILLPQYSTIMAHNISSFLKTRSGLGLRSFYAKTKGHYFYQPLIVRSADAGKSWEYASSIASLGELGFDETSLVQMENGNILAMMRPNPIGDQHLYRSFSDNGGVSWSLPEKTNIIGYPANTINYEGNIVVSYGYRTFPMGIRVQVLAKDGVTPLYPELVLRDDNDIKSRQADVGYPTTVSLGKGRFFTVYYITVDQQTFVAGTRWHINSEPTLQSGLLN
jgi:hypothetical protein